MVSFFSRMFIDYLGFSTDRTKKIQNRTFDSSILATDVSKFVSSAETDEASSIRVLSNFDDRNNTKSHTPFSGFIKYDRKLKRKTYDESQHHSIM